jgi:hypothetical protein
VKIDEEVRRVKRARKPEKVPDKRTDPLEVLSSMGVSLRLPDTASAKPVRTVSRAPFWAAAIIALVVVLAVVLHYLGARLVGPEGLSVVMPSVAPPATPSQTAPETTSSETIPETTSETTPETQARAASPAPQDPPETASIPIRIKTSNTEPTSRPRRHLLHHSLLARRSTRVALKRRKRRRARPKKRVRRRARARSSVDAEVDDLLSGRSRSASSRSAEVDVDALLSAGN